MRVYVSPKLNINYISCTGNCHLTFLILEMHQLFFIDMTKAKQYTGRTLVTINLLIVKFMIFIYCQLRRNISLTIQAFFSDAFHPGELELNCQRFQLQKSNTWLFANKINNDVRILMNQNVSRWNSCWIQYHSVL